MADQVWIFWLQVMTDLCEEGKDGINKYKT